MEGRRRDDSGHVSRYRRLTVVLVCVLLVLAVGVVGFSLTEAKTEKRAQKTNSKEVKAENKGCEKQEDNPLELEQYPEVTAAVNDYFVGLHVNKDFIESYDNLQVYTKLGRYKDTYVTFVTYDMKIKDIYTKVPGMETLYVDKAKKSTQYEVKPKIKEGKLADFVKLVAAHEDVENLMAEVEQNYQNALQSDALLREALLDLQNAYENSTGTSSQE